MPPVLPLVPLSALYQFHTVSDTHDPPGPLVVKVVPPTTVTYGSSEGGERPPVKAPLSPEARKNDWPWPRIAGKLHPCWHRCLKPHEQLNCLAASLVAMQFRTALGAVTLSVGPS